MKDHKIMMWRVLSLAVALFAALSLTFAPVLVPDFSLTPVFAGDDDDDDDDDNNNDRVRLTRNDCRGIVAAAVTQANLTPSAFRVNSAGATQMTKMHIACVDREGEIVLFRSMSDAWGGKHRHRNSESEHCTGL